MCYALMVDVFITEIVLLYLQDVLVRVPGWTGRPDALWNVPAPGDEDGTCSSSINLRLGLASR